MKDLNNFRKKITSQNGEDGIILEIFKRIGTKNKYCVEFGTYNGLEYSNTWNLVKNLDWKSVYIEGDKKSFLKLRENFSSFKNVICLFNHVNHYGENKLDSILLKTSIPKNFDLLSIDVDGNEYHIWRSLVEYKPRVVIIETNPTMPPEIDFVGPPGNTDIGSSASAMVKLAKSKGYELAAHTPNNCIFVNSKEFSKLKIKVPSLNHIFDKNEISYLISTYDGRLFTYGTPRFTRKRRS